MVRPRLVILTEWVRRPARKDRKNPTPKEPKSVTAPASESGRYDGSQGDLQGKVKTRTLKAGGCGTRRKRSRLKNCDCFSEEENDRHWEESGRDNEQLLARPDARGESADGAEAEAFVKLDGGSIFAGDR